MTHFRRYEFKKRRYCSTPAIANLHDFSDHFVEDLKNKIKVEQRDGDECKQRSSTLTESRRRQLPESQATIRETEDEGLDPIMLSNLNLDASGSNQPYDNYSPLGAATKASSELETSEFKSAKWLSESELIFSLTNQVGGLVRALRIFQELGIGVKHVESRKSKRRDSEFEIFVDIDCSDPEKMKNLVHHLRHEVNCLTKEEFERSPALIRQSSQVQSPLSVASFDATKPPEVGYRTDQAQQTGTGSNGNNKALALMVQPSIDFESLMEGMPWFPRHISELDMSSNRVLMYGNELDADHPGFRDPVYRKRRKEFTEIAYNYRHGDPVPRIDYTAEETKTWSVIFQELATLYDRYACREFIENFKLLTQYCGYRKDNIPQLEDISQFLKARTGFTVRPVAGYLSSRDFLAGLAFRVFHCTQYIRHSSDPFYTPEPDCCHELLGHCPLLADRNFAQFSQELGLASLGASDEEVDKLATCYFFTIEFGLCKEGNQMKVYGAGLLSSIAELKHAVSNNAHIIPFDPVVTCQATPIITAFQEAYFVTDSFDDAKLQMRDFSFTIKRPFGLRYNPYTQSVEILSNTRRIMALVSELKGDICTIRNAIRTLDDDDEDKRKLNDLEHLIAAP